MEIIKEARLHITLTVLTLDQFTCHQEFEMEHSILFDLCFSFVRSTSFDDDDVM